MGAIKAKLNIDHIQKQAEGAIQGTLIAEITHAQENIRFSVQQRTQAIYYLLGFMGAAAALVLTADSFITTALNARSGLRFTALTLAAQFLLCIVSLLAAVVYGVVFKANDAVRCYTREILRLNDVLYGFPDGINPANPGWVAVRVTAYAPRDKDEVFSERSVSEGLALVVYSFALVMLVVFTIALQHLGEGILLPLIATIAGEFYVLSLLYVAWRWIRPLYLVNDRFSKHDRDVNASQLCDLESPRKEE